MPSIYQSMLHHCSDHWVTSVGSVAAPRTLCQLVLGYSTLILSIHLTCLYNILVYSGNVMSCYPYKGFVGPTVLGCARRIFLAGNRVLLRLWRYLKMSGSEFPSSCLHLFAATFSILPLHEEGLNTLI